MSENVITICDCPIKDSIFNIKKSLEESTICRVRKIFAVPYCEQGKNEPTKKRVYVWVEWGDTNAAWIFTARLNHHREEALFKLDNWDQPIVTARDEYGNPTQHAHWVVLPASKEKVWEDELYFRSRDSDNWEKYLAQGESVYDTDEESAEPAKGTEASGQTDQVEKTEETQKLVLPIPKLIRQKAEIVENKSSNALGCLSLLLPDPQEEDDEPPELDQNGWNEIFGFEIPMVAASHSSQLSRKELHQLSCGTLKCYGDLPPECIHMEK